MHKVCDVLAQVSESLNYGGNDMRDTSRPLTNHMERQERDWLIQRIGWFFWGAIILAALLGLIGPGPLSTTVIRSDDDTATVGYDKYLHYHCPTSLEVLVKPEDDQEEFQVSISRSLIDKLEIRRIEPEPHQRVLSEHEAIYSFRRQSPVPAKIVIHAEYQSFGNVVGEIGLVDHATARVAQFVYP
jgi:hypothetical protein